MGLCRPVAMIAYSAALGLGRIAGGELMVGSRKVHPAGGHVWLEIAPDLILDAPVPGLIALSRVEQRRPQRFVRHERRLGHGASMAVARRLEGACPQLRYFCARSPSTRLAG
jgi:hypothetical protein